MFILHQETKARHKNDEPYIVRVSQFAVMSGETLTLAPRLNDCERVAAVKLLPGELALFTVTERLAGVN